MYFPKSQIQTNKYTNGGEFKYASTGEEYEGSYFSTSTGEYFSEKTPNDKSRKLVPIENDILERNLDGDPGVLGNYGESGEVIYTVPQSYVQVSKLDFSSPPKIPKSFFPKPTEDDYVTGEITRFFLSKRTEPRFIEIDKETQVLYLQQDPTVQFKIYSAFSIPWQIRGDKNKIAQINYNIVKNQERRGFEFYFKGRWDQFWKE